MQKLVATAFVLTVIAFTSPASAYTEEERMACQDDAFRLCGQAIPDQERVKQCLIANMSRLSPACRRLFNRPRS